MTPVEPDRVVKGSNFRAHFIHVHNGYRNGRRQVASTYPNLGFRTFRNARATVTPTTMEHP